MKIAVLVKQVPDTWGERRIDATTGRVDRFDGEQVIDEINERALEVALSYRDSAKGTEVVAISAGPAGVKDSLRKALSIGADSAIHILDDALTGADAAATAAALAAAVHSGGFSLVISGNVSTDGRGGVVPAMIAEHLNLPQLSSLDTVELTDVDVSGERTVDEGSQRLRARLPALISVTERTPEARFPSFRNIMSAKKKPVSTVTLADLGVTRSAATSVVLTVTERPARAAGRIVIDDGHAAEELVAYLATEQLV